MTYKEFTEDGNWEEAFRFTKNLHQTPGSRASQKEYRTPFVFRPSDVDEAFLVEGINDGDPWLCLFRVVKDDGQYTPWYALTAWCDFTGWDCRAGGACWMADSRENALQYGFTDEERERMKTALHVKK